MIIENNQMGYWLKYEDTDLVLIILKPLRFKIASVINLFLNK